MATYDPIGDVYDLVYPDTAERVPFVKRILEKFGKQAVLELGIGTGLFAIPLHEAGLNIEGLEISQVMIDVVPGRGAGMSLESPQGVRFIVRSRVFTDEEYAALEAAGGPVRGC